MSGTTTTSTTASALRAEIKGALSTAGLSKVPPEILSQCVAVATTLQLSPKQLAECWEAFSLNRNLSELTDRWMPSFKNELLKQSDRSAELLLRHAKPLAVVSASTTTQPDTDDGSHDHPSNSNNNKRDSQGLHMVTPPAKKAWQQQSSAPFHSAAQQAPSSAGGRTRVSLSPGPPPRKNNAERLGNHGGTNSSSSSSNHPYHDRTNRGKVVFTYNPNNLEAVPIISDAAATSPSSSRSTPKCLIDASFPSNVSEPYRHMFTTLDERALALDQHLVQLGDAIATQYDIRVAASDYDYNPEDGGGHTTTTSSPPPAPSEIAPLEAVGVPRQEKVCCLGRICNSAHEGRINDTSILLEGSRHTSGGQRVALDLSMLKAANTPYSVFPGQIVAIEGINTSGRKLVAHRLCEGAAPPTVTSSAGDLMRFHHDDAGQGGTSVRMAVACGPFTTSDDLDYAPLSDLLQQLLVEPPDVVILLGPFVDVKHATVWSGHTTLNYQDGGDGTNGIDDGGDEVCVPYETLFANKVAALLEDFYVTQEGLTTQFVLVPSLEDATADWVYPQPPFQDRIPHGKSLALPGSEGIEAGTLGLHHVEAAGREMGPPSHRHHHRRVHCVSNPCTLRINEVVVGVTSTDALFHMSADETNANLESGSRLGRLCQHLLQQQSYYPLFPASVHKANLNLKKMDQWRMPCQPDLLIVPSTLKTFAQTVLEGTVAVNPGRLTLGRLAGTYAMVEIHPMEREVLERVGGDEVELRHAIPERTRIEIKRI